MISRILIFYFLLCPLFSFAQKEDRVWVFDDSISVDWNDTLNPIVYNVSMNTPFYNENYASIADKNGNLLYYVAEGSQYLGYSGFFGAIYNDNEIIIPNGDSIGSDRSITNGNLFIPSLIDSNITYLFYLAQDASSTAIVEHGFYYALIDRTIGCISKVNLLLNDTLTEKLTAVRHGNGRDWWILIHKNESKIFYKFLFTPQGITGPFLQNIGPKLTNYSAGQMKFSPDGSKLGLVSIEKHVSLFDFDRCTGVLSNYKNLGNFKTYGCSFSPSGKIFYTSTIYSNSGIDSLFQYNLDSSNILASRFLLWTDRDSFLIGQHLLGPNGKIYIANLFNAMTTINIYDTANMNLSVITEPDVYGSGCNFQPYSFNLNGGRCRLGLPNMVNYGLGALAGSACDTLNCMLSNSQTIKLCVGDSIYLQGAYQTTAGIYHDTLNNAVGCDSIVITTVSMQVPVNDSVIQTSDTLTAQLSGVTYQWFNCVSSANISGATSQSFVATTTGHFAVWVTDGFNCSMLSACVFVDVLGVGSWMVDGVLELMVYPNPTEGQLTVSLVNGEWSIVNEIIITDALGVTVVKLKQTKPRAQINIKSFTAGIYFVKVRMKDGSVTVRKFIKQ